MKFKVETVVYDYPAPVLIQTKEIAGLEVLGTIKMDDLVKVSDEHTERA